MDLLCCFPVKRIPLLIIIFKIEYVVEYSLENFPAYLDYNILMPT
jgi:hypothetical protein